MVWLSPSREFRTRCCTDPGFYASQRGTLWLALKRSLGNPAAVVSSGGRGCVPGGFENP